MDIVRNELLWYIKMVFTPRFDVIQRPNAWEARCLVCTLQRRLLVIVLMLFRLQDQMFRRIRCK